MAAHVDVETWKRRTGILQLRLASLQEDVDMYAMRVQLLDSETAKECSEKALVQASTRLLVVLTISTCVPITVAPLKKMSVFAYSLWLRDYHMHVETGGSDSGHF